MPECGSVSLNRIRGVSLFELLIGTPSALLIQEDKSTDPDVKATPVRLTQFCRFYCI